MATRNEIQLRKLGVGSIEEIALPNEIWKDIPIDNFKGLYYISSFGRIYAPSRPRKTYLINCSISICPPALIRGSIGCNGYYKTIFTDNNGIRKCYSIHRLVAMAFIDNPENKPQVNHINGIKTDNNLSNLEWATIRENSLHSYSIGKSKPTRFREVFFIKDCSIISFDTIGKAMKHFKISKEKILRHERDDEYWNGYQIKTFFNKTKAA